MKKLISINVILLSFFLPVVTNSYRDSLAIKDKTKKIEVGSAARKDNTETNSARNDLKAAVTTWNADAEKAQINFVVNGPFGKVNGKLSGLKSTIRFAVDNLAASSFRASVDPKSIRTGIGLRNRDLQKEKFLDLDNHPLISFESEKIQKNGTGYKAFGNLTIKGVTKSVQIPFTFTEKANSGLFKGSFTVQREDFGVGKKGGSIGNDINIKLEVPVTKSK